MDPVCRMTFLPILMRVLGSVVALLILGLGFVWSLRLGYADHLFHTGTPEGVKRAVELAPGNARHQARWAAILEDSGQDVAAARRALEAALALNPRDSASWMALGLAAERDGELQKAEKCLLEAARVDRQYDPRWTLVNFYFRTSDWENFWLWAREAAAIPYRDSAALFRLCWRATEDPEMILNRAIPEPALARYLSFLLDDAHVEALEAAAQKVAARAGREDLPVLLASCDRLLEAHQFPAALGIWTILCRRQLVPCQPLEPQRGPSLTNGDFRTPALSSGFDWRLHAPEGVSITRSESPPAMRWILSGRQPESCPLLSQYIPLLPDKQYRFRFRYWTSGIAPDTGLRWQIFDAATGAELAGRSSHLSSEKQIEQEVAFSTPVETRVVRLALTYQRASGTTRLEGSIFLSHASLESAAR